MTQEANISHENAPTHPGPGGQVGRNRFVVGRGALGRNLAANAVNMVGTAIVVLWFTPYLLHKLGVTGFGLVALAASVLPLMGLSTVVVNSAVSRHATIHLEHGEIERANQTLNTSLWASLLLVALLVPIAAVAIIHASSLFVVPAGYVRELQALLCCTVAVFVCLTVNTPFQISTVSTNRLDVANVISLGYTLIRAGVVVVIFQLTVARVWHIGIGLAAAAAATSAATLIAWRFLTPELRLSPRLIDRSAFAELTSTGGWALLDLLGSLLLLSAELVLVNRILGPNAGGQYAAAQQLPVVIRSALLGISPVFLPPMLYLFARGDTAQLAICCCRSIRLLGVAAAIPVGLVCGLSKPLLTLWLGSQAASMAPLLVLLTIHLSLTFGMHPLLVLQLATNRMRTPALATAFLGIANIGLATWLAGPLRWGMYGVAAAGVVTMSVRMLLFAPLYMGRSLGVSSLPVYRESAIVGSVTAGLAAAAWLVSSQFVLDSWLDIVVAACATSAIFVLGALPLLRSKVGRESMDSISSLLCGYSRRPANSPRTLS